jgi:hypothetical protein
LSSIDAKVLSKEIQAAAEILADAQSALEIVLLFVSLYMNFLTTSRWTPQLLKAGQEQYS